MQSLKHLLDIYSLEKNQIEYILSLGQELKEILYRPIPKVPTLRGKLIVNLFYEPSTRTRFSFERAAKILSADTLNFSKALTSLEKGETLLDTIKNLKAIGANLFVIRHPCSGICHFLAKHTNVPIVNAGDGTHEHPTQALLDLLTVKEKLNKFSGLRVTIVGDIKHSRVAHSDILAFQKMGAQVTITGPLTLLPENKEISYFDLYKNKFKVELSLEKALLEADVVIVLRIQKERHGIAFIPSYKEYHQFFGITYELLDKYLSKGGILLHPGPINWGIELAPSVEKFPNQVILEQVENGVAIRMAVLLILLAGKKDENFN